MTEPEVLEKLGQFKEKLLKFRDERNTAREELALIKEQLAEKIKIIDTLTQEHASASDSNQDALKNLQVICDQKDQLYKDLKEKAFHSVKHLVENIESKESEIDNLNSLIMELKNNLEATTSKSSDALQDKTAEIDKLNSRISDLETTISTVSDDYENLKSELASLKKSIESDYIEKSIHQDEIKKILEDKAKSDEEKQTVLSNTWKTQIQTSKELREVTQKLDVTEELLRQEKADTESLKASLDEKIAEFEAYKINADSKLKEYEQDVKKIDTNTQLEISRLTERVKELTTIRGELELKNKELVDKIKNLELQKSQVTLNESEKTSVPQERNLISKETVPYRFGSTTPTVMQKAKNFIDELYKDSVQMNNVYILGNPKPAADKAGLTEKEYEVFMNRLSECLEYNGVPLLYQQDGNWKSNLSKIKLVDYISSVSGR